MLLSRICLVTLVSSILLVGPACTAELEEGCLGGVCSPPGQPPVPSNTTSSSSGTGGSGGSGGSSCETTPATGDFPCEVFTVLQNNCHSCHQSPPSNGAPYSLLTYEDTREFNGATTIPRWQRMGEVIQSGFMPFGTTMSDPDKQVILDWIDTDLGGAPVTHVVVSHHHEDHVAGVRVFVATGATLVVHEVAETFFDEVVTAPSTIEPDRLEDNPVAATIETIPTGGLYVLDDPTNPITVYEMVSTHAQDMVLPYVESSGIAFTVDIFSPNFGANPFGAQEVLDAHSRQTWRSCSMSCPIARARWLWRFLVSASSSATVRPRSGMNISGS